MATNNTPEGEPEWVRVPQAVAKFGVSRPKLYRLAAEGKITSASLRSAGETKGTRLFHVESLRNYIESCIIGG